MSDSASQIVTISRLFRDFPHAQEAVQRLEREGLSPDDVSVVANNSEKWFSPDWAAAAAKGAAVGAGFGGIGGLLAGLGMLAVPGLGPIVAAGWLAATAVGAGAIGAAGGVIGLLAEAGVATNEAEVYAESIRRGGSFVSARVPLAEKARFEAVLAPDAVDIGQQRAALTQAGWTPNVPAA